MRKPYWVFWATLTVGVVLVGIAANYIISKHLTPHKPTPAVVVVSAPPTPGELHMQLIQKFYHATALMYFPTPDGGEKMACTATAFQQVVDSKTGFLQGYLFASASHCVDGKKFVDLTRDEWPDGGKKTYYHAMVVAQSDRSKGIDASVLLVITTDLFDLMPLGHNPKELGEPILNLSGPQGAPKQVFLGVISSLYMNRPIVLEDDGSTWEGFLLAQVYGEGPGSSGSMIVCENQAAACGITVGHGAGFTAFMPIDRFNEWWDGVKSGKINPHPTPDRDTGDVLAAPVGKALPKKAPGIGKPLP